MPLAIITIRRGRRCKVEGLRGKDFNPLRTDLTFFTKVLFSVPFNGF